MSKRNSTRALDWSQVQETLFQLIRADVQTFAAQHQAETFYCLFLDCNAACFEVLVKVNTLESLREDVFQFQQRNRYRDQKRGREKSVEHLEHDWRWNCGNWRYEINSPAWKKSWAPIVTSMGAFLDDPSNFFPDFAKSFLLTACRALVQVECSGVLNELHRTRDFRTICADHDETVLTGYRRLNRVRKTMVAT